MSPKLAYAVFLAAICGVLPCGCGKSQMSNPAEYGKGSESPEAIEMALKQQASVDAFTALKKEKPRGDGVVLDGFKVENVSVLKYREGNFSVTCTATYKWVSPETSLVCKDKLFMHYDRHGKQTFVNRQNESVE